MPDKRKLDAARLGKHGENIAVNYLIDNGYILLETNKRVGHKEIDIIARKGDMLVVVEVKSRSEGMLVSPESAVDNRKIRHLINAAEKYIFANNISLDTRFDIITIVENSDGTTRLEHIEDAFVPPLQ